jgi:hypothetical protein
VCASRRVGGLTSVRFDFCVTVELWVVTQCCLNCLQDNKASQTPAAYTPCSVGPRTRFADAGDGLHIQMAGLSAYTTFSKQSRTAGKG